MKSFDYIPLYTHKDYLQWEGDWELINGHPHAMSPSPVRKHQFLNLEIAAELRDNLKKQSTVCKNCRAFQDLDWVVDDNTVVRPDLMIVCGEFKGDFLNFPPTLVVEVLSPATTMKDRHVKYRLYELQKVRYYILVNPDTQACEMFELKGEEYAAVNNLQRFELGNNCFIDWDMAGFVGALKMD
jgi:Uma2 family endonuclease